MAKPPSAAHKALVTAELGTRSGAVGGWAVADESVSATTMVDGAGSDSAVASVTKVQDADSAAPAQSIVPRRS